VEPVWHYDIDSKSRCVCITRPLQVTMGACRFRSRRAERVRLLAPGVTTPADGYFGERSRLAGHSRFSEGEPLAPELSRYRSRLFVGPGAGSIDGAARLLSAEEVAGPGRRRLRAFGGRAQCLVRSRACVEEREQSAFGVPAPRIRKGGAPAERNGFRRLRRARAGIGRKSLGAFGLKGSARTVTRPLQLTRGAGRCRSRAAERVRRRGLGVTRPSDGYFGVRSPLAE